MLSEAIEGASAITPPLWNLPPQTELSGLTNGDARSVPAAQAPLGDRVEDANLRKRVAIDVAGDLPKCDSRVAQVIGDIIIHHRRYEDLRRAIQRLDLQAKSIQRFAGEGAAVEAWLIPYREGMAPLEAAARAEEKHLAKMAKGLPVYAWSKEVAGLSDRFLALIVGEAGRPISDYRNPACLWKRMGMAVIDGGRQRRVAGDAALAHGYVPRRRALMWNIGESILKQQIRKTEEGERFAIGSYGQVYIDRRAYETEKNGEKYSHARAKRYMEKRLLRELWKAWRDA